MQFFRDFYRDLTLKPQGFTMVVAGFLPVFAIVAMFPVVGAIIDHFRDTVPDAAQRVPQMVTAPGYAIAVLAPFAGIFADRFGRRLILLACTFFYAIVGAIPFFLENLDVIFASRILLGVCEAGILTVVNTLIADYWRDSGRRNWLMLQGLIGPFFQSLVFIVVAQVAAWRWNGSFLVYLAAVPIFIAMYFFIFEPGKADSPAIAPVEETGGDEPFPLGAAFAVGGLTLFASVLYYVFIVNGSLAWRELGVTDPMAISKATFIPSMFILVGAVIFRLVSGFSNAVQIGAFLAILGAGLLGIGASGTMLEMQISLALQQTGAGMAVPSLIAWAQNKFSFRHRGRGMGVWTSTFFLGQAVSPILVGLAAKQGGSMQSAFVMAGAIALVAALIAMASSLLRKG